MKRLRWQLLIVFLALIAIGVLLAGQQPVTVQVFEPEPVSGGSYTEGLIGAHNRLNPVFEIYNSADQDVNRLLYSSLVRFDDRGLPQPDLAESWGISRDATVYNFSLRTTAIWHDGEPVTTADVIFTIDLLRSPDLPIPEDIRVLWNAIEVEAFNEHTLQFRLPEPFAPFLDYLTFGILPAHQFVGVDPAGLVDDPFNLAPVGSGPYRFERFTVSDGVIAGVELMAFKHYYLGVPFVEEFKFLYFDTAADALAAYQAGEIQGLSHITPEILDAALAEGNLNLYTSRLPEMTIIFLNLDNPQVPFFQESDIRKALLMGLNRQWIVDRMLAGQAVIADGPIFPNTWAYYEGISRSPYDPEKASNMIKAAGYTIPADGGVVRGNADGLLAFTLVHPEGEPYQSIAEFIQTSWAELGVGVEIQAVPFEQLISGYLDTRLYEAALVDINLAQSPDPDPYPFWHQTQATGGQNYALWNDRTSSEYLEQGRIIVDPAERTRLYRNFQVRFMNELPALPLYYPMYTYGVDATVQGVKFGPLFSPAGRFDGVTDWFLFSERVVGEDDTNP
jgi:peptide/nickel transport system substrate-binding protein